MCCDAAVMADCEDSVDIHDAELPVERMDADVPLFSNSPVLCCFFRRRPCNALNRHS